MKNRWVKQVAKDIFIDAAFMATENRSFTYPENVRNPSLLTHISEQITRVPSDLRLHVQRIRLAEMLDMPEALAEAIGDLFITLGDKGIELRTNLLNRYESCIPNEWRRLFQSHFEQGLLPETRLPKRSRLTTGGAGHKDFIAPKKQQGTPLPEEKNGSHILEAIRDMQDSGQLEEACSTLENWLPNADEIFWREGAQELARLYRYMDNGEVRANDWWKFLWDHSPARAEYWAEFLKRDVTS